MSAGGLFHPNDVNQENVFKHAIHDVNANHHILSRSNLSGQIEKVSPQDSFHASKRGNDNTIIRLFNMIIIIIFWRCKTNFCWRHYITDIMSLFVSVRLQYAVCSGSASPRFSARSPPKYPVTSSRFAIQWKYPIWRRDGTTSCAERAVWSTFTRTRLYCPK